jgi:hypothetical protein
MARESHGKNPDHFSVKELDRLIKRVEAKRIWAGKSQIEK